MNIDSSASQITHQALPSRPEQPRADQASERPAPQPTQADAGGQKTRHEPDEHSVQQGSGQDSKQAGASDGQSTPATPAKAESLDPLGALLDVMA